MNLGVEAGIELRPRLRGTLHEVAFFVSCVVGTLFVFYTPRQDALGGAIFAGSVCVMLGTSTLYHKVTWRPAVRAWMRRADHTAIFLLIAGTYTPVALIGLHGAWRTTVLAVVWSGALLAAVIKMCWIGSPKWISVALAIALGWAAVAALPQLARNEGLIPFFLLVGGGLAYTAGAVVYAIRRPNPAPRTFGYHEVFHALTLVALGCQYVAIAFFIVHVT